MFCFVLFYFACVLHPQFFNYKVYECIFMWQPAYIHFICTFVCYPFSATMTFAGWCVCVIQQLCCKKVFCFVSFLIALELKHIFSIRSLSFHPFFIATFCSIKITQNLIVLLAEICSPLPPSCQFVVSCFFSPIPVTWITCLSHYCWSCDWCECTMFNSNFKWNHRSDIYINTTIYGSFAVLLYIFNALAHCTFQLLVVVVVAAVVCIIPCCLFVCVS